MNNNEISQIADKYILQFIKDIDCQGNDEIERAIEVLIVKSAKALEVATDDLDRAVNVCGRAAGIVRDNPLPFSNIK